MNRRERVKALGSYANDRNGRGARRSVVIATIAVTLACTAGAVPHGPSMEQDSPGIDQIPPAVTLLPDTMTVEEMNAIPMDGVIDIGSSDPAVAPPSTRAVPTAASGSRCYLNPGNMWGRTSGSGYRYGAIGSKPRLHSCTPDVRKTGMASEVWQFNGWFWFKASGPFNSYGTGNMQQKSVQHICTGRGEYPYKVITTAWGTDGKGRTGVGRDETREFRFDCG